MASSSCSPQKTKVRMIKAAQENVAMSNFNCFESMGKVNHSDKQLYGWSTFNLLFF